MPSNRNGNLFNESVSVPAAVASSMKSLSGKLSALALGALRAPFVAGEVHADFPLIILIFIY